MNGLARWEWPRPDPRLYQVATLAGLLVWGVTRLDFEIPPARAATILASALFAQWALSRAFQLPAFEPKSALISGLSLCLLLRTNSAAVTIFAPLLAVASKFLLRARGKHVFNPTNIALVVMLATSRAWVSPGQWGNTAYFLFLFACVGGIVVQRAARADVTLAFLATWSAILFGRAAWLGQRLAVPVHQLESGALLLFAFFMISDPRTTPDSRAGRVAFGALVAIGAGAVQFLLYRTNGLLWSLAALAPVVPLLDRVLPAGRFTWESVTSRPGTIGKGDTYETPLPASAVPRSRVGVARV